MFKNKFYSENLAHLLLELKKDIAQCEDCFRFFVIGKNKGKICNICSSPNIDSSTLMIVEKDSDLDSVHKSGIYNGKYFILGGLVPIVEKNTKSRVRIEELKKKISNALDIQEVILAFSLSPQGNHTDMYVREQLNDISKKQNIKISSLGKGLSTGTELEYSDNDTLKNALKNRQ